ncbi:MAG: HEPN domain-containing protein [Bacteroidales bacterium]|nr:HEPN domain-containing protein [Bacteroidales bacterium]
MIANLALKKQHDRIIKLITRANNSFAPDDEMLSEIAKYGCVLCSGFLENSISLIFSEFVKSNIQNQPIINYTNKCLKQIQNPKKGIFIELIKTFNFDWSNELEEFINQEERGASINYIITERHRIAHGDNSEITVHRLMNHFSKAIEVVKFIEKKTITPNRQHAV